MVVGVFELGNDDMEVEVEKTDVEIEMEDMDVSEDLEDGTRAGIMVELDGGEGVIGWCRGVERQLNSLGEEGGAKWGWEEKDL